MLQGMLFVTLKSVCSQYSDCFLLFHRKCNLLLKVTCLSLPQRENLEVLSINVVAGECNVKTYLCKQKSSKEYIQSSCKGQKA